MVRQYKSRRVSFLPSTTYFKPMGIPLKCLEEVKLTMEEAEALRLKDLEGLEQEEGAVKMNISRPTFQRVLASARQKIAEALLKGKAIRIEGGHFEVAPTQLKCAQGHIWSVSSELVTSSNKICPVCHSARVELLSPVRINCPFEGRYLCCKHCPRIAPVDVIAETVDTLKQNS